jgi:hypothetical protein
MKMTMMMNVMTTTLLFLGTTPVSADCIASNAEFNAFFEGLNGGVSIPLEGSCCMKDVCGLPCPEEVSKPGPGME